MGPQQQVIASLCDECTAIDMLNAHVLRRCAARALPVHLAAHGRWRDCRTSAFSLGMMWEALAQGGRDLLLDNIDLVLGAFARCPAESQAHRAHLEGVRRFVAAFGERLG